MRLCDTCRVLLVKAVVLGEKIGDSMRRETIFHACDADNLSSPNYSFLPDICYGKIESFRQNRQNSDYFVNFR